MRRRRESSVISQIFVGSCIAMVVIFGLYLIADKDKEEVQPVVPQEVEVV